MLVSTSGSRTRPGQALPRGRSLGFDPACPLERDWTGMRPRSCERRGSGDSSGGLGRGGPLSRPLSYGVCAVTGTGRRGCLNGPRKRFGRGSGSRGVQRPADLVALAAPAHVAVDSHPRARYRADIGALETLRVDRAAAVAARRPAPASREDGEALGLATEVRTRRWRGVRLWQALEVPPDAGLPPGVGRCALPRRRASAPVLLPGGLERRAGHKPCACGGIGSPAGETGPSVRSSLFGSSAGGVWAGLDSNQGPTDYESAALTN